MLADGFHLLSAVDSRNPHLLSALNVLILVIKEYYISELYVLLLADGTHVIVLLHTCYFLSGDKGKTTNTVNGDGNLVLLSKFDIMS